MNAFVILRYIRVGRVLYRKWLKNQSVRYKGTCTEMDSEYFIVAACDRMVHTVNRLIRFIHIEVKA